MSRRLLKFADSTGDLLSNVQDTNDAIKNIVTATHWQEIYPISSVQRAAWDSYLLLLVVEVDNTIGRLYDKMCFKQLSINMRFLMSYFFLQRLKLAIFWHSATSDSVDHHCSSQQVWPQSQHVFKAENLSFILILHKLNRRQFIHTEAFHTMRRALHVLSAVMSLGQCECCKCIAFNSLLSQKLPQVAYQPLTVRQNVVIPKLHDESPCRINTDKSDKRNSH